MSNFQIRCMLFLSVIILGKANMNAQNWQTYYKERELKIPQNLNVKLKALRSEISAKKLSYTVSYTTAVDKPLAQLTGLKLSPTMNSSMKAYLAKQPIMSDKPKVGAFPRQFSTSTEVGCIRDQGGCGGCWAFGAMAAYEINYAKKTGNSLCDIDVSEQLVINCSGAGSCGGGDPWGVYDWMVGRGQNVDAEQFIPYAGQDQACAAPTRSSYYYALRWGSLNPNGDWRAQPSINTIKNAILEYGAVTSCLLATDRFVWYSGGVFNETPTSSLDGANINHCIAIVGWDDSRNAWRIKNSWGAGWGEGGYMWIDYNCNNIGKCTAWIDAKVPSSPQLSPSFVQNQLSTWLYTGDIDGNGVDEFLRIRGSELEIYRPDFEKNLVLKHRFPATIKRLVIGDFVKNGREHGKKQVCAILSDGTLQAFAISDDLKSLWWWFTQPNFIQDTEDFVVGDFDGDKAEEILVHTPSTGKIRFYKINGTAVFSDFNKYSLGNLTGRNLVNKKILKGEFGETNQRCDLIVVDYAARQIQLFATAMEANGNFTFWWGFTTNANLFNATSRVYVANVDGGERSGVVIRDEATGKFWLLKSEYLNGNLALATNVNIGQLPVRIGKAQIGFMKVSPNKVRDDVMLLSEPERLLIFVGSANDNGALTYWWGYTSDRIF